MSSNLAPATSNDNVDNKKESAVALTPSPHLSAEMSPELSPQFGALQIDSQTHDVDNTTGQTGTNGNDQSQEPKRKRSVYTIDSKKRCEKLFPSTINCCGKWKISRFQYLSFCRLIVIVGILSTYLVYQLIYYFNPMTNSKQWVDVDTTDTYPMPYLYVEWELPLTVLETYNDNYTWSCDYDIDISSSETDDSSDDDDNTISVVTLTYDNLTDLYGNIDFDTIDETEMELLLTDYKDSWIIIEYNLNNSFPWDYNIFLKNGYRTQGEMLIIPPYDETATVTIETGNTNDIDGIDGSDNNNNSTLTRVEKFLQGDLMFTVACTAIEVKVDEVIDAIFNDTSYESLNYTLKHGVTSDLYSSTIWYHINTRESLLNYQNLNLFFSDNYGIYDYADLALGGYFATLEYEWFHFDNTVAGSEGYYEDEDYLVSSFTGIFDFIKYHLSYNIDYASDIIYLQIKPDSAGKKTTFVTRQELNWADVISNVGGFYGSFAGIIAFIFIVLVWGFDVNLLGKFGVKFRGLDENAAEDLSKQETKKLEAFIKQYVLYQLAKQQKEQKQQ